MLGNRFGVQGSECPYMRSTRCDAKPELRCACGYIDGHLGPHHCKHCGGGWEHVVTYERRDAVAP